MSAFPDISHYQRISALINVELNRFAEEDMKKKPIQNAHSRKRKFSEDSDDDDDSGSDISVDTLLSWVKTSLPSTKQSSLLVNQAYQDLTGNLAQRAQEILSAIRRRIAEIEDLVTRSNQKPEKSKKARKIKASLYTPPYFRDSSGLCPPLCNEAKRKMQEELNFNMLSEQPRKFSKKEREILTEAVGKAFWQNKTEVENIKLTQLEKKLISEDSVAECDTKKIEVKLKATKKNLLKLNKAREIGHKIDKKFEPDWQQIATERFEGSRSARECRLFWTNELRSEISKVKEWTKDELNLLKQLAEEKPRLNFLEISQKLKTNRTAFQCFEKYQTDLNDNLIRKQWNSEEDAKLTDAVRQTQQGDFVPWDQVTNFLDGRLRSQCQVRWERSLDPNLRHGRWTPEEDKALVAAVQRRGTKDWGDIARGVPGRSESQCRERFCTVLDSNIRLRPWTAQEDAILGQGVALFGAGKWSQIRRMLDARTPAMCKNRYISLNKLIRRNSLKIHKQAEKMNKKAIKMEEKAIKMEQKNQKKFQATLGMEKRKRGRPRKDEAAPKIEKTDAQIDEKMAEIEKRKRGRPRKEANSPKIHTKMVKINEKVPKIEPKELKIVEKLPEVEKKKRGRPKKDENWPKISTKVVKIKEKVPKIEPTQSQIVENPPEVEKKKRGRPKKDENSARIHAKVPKISEEVPKVHEINEKVPETETNDTQIGEKQVEIGKKKRGRPRK